MRIFQAGVIVSFLRPIAARLSGPAVMAVSQNHSLSQRCVSSAAKVLTSIRFGVSNESPLHDLSPANPQASSRWDREEHAKKPGNGTPDDHDQNDSNEIHFHLRPLQPGR
jgi:hypothetical protein